MVVEDNDRAQEEEQDVINSEDRFVPDRERAGHELSDEILDDEHQPDPSVGVGESVALKAIG